VGINGNIESKNEHLTVTPSCSIACKDASIRGCQFAIHCTYRVSTQFMVATVRMFTPERKCYCTRTHVRFTGSGVGSNSILECRFLSENAHRTIFFADGDGARPFIVAIAGECVGEFGAIPSITSTFRVRCNGCRGRTRGCCPIAQCCFGALGAIKTLQVGVGRCESAFGRAARVFDCILRRAPSVFERSLPYQPVRGSGRPRGMLLVARMQELQASRRKTQWHSSSVDFCRKCAPYSAPSFTLHSSLQPTAVRYISYDGVYTSVDTIEAWKWITPIPGCGPKAPLFASMGNPYPRWSTIASIPSSSEILPKNEHRT
jgi:hypothetical protein